jgi:hypothetical protein
MRFRFPGGRGSEPARRFGVGQGSTQVSTGFRVGTFLREGPVLFVGLTCRLTVLSSPS